MTAVWEMSPNVRRKQKKTVWNTGRFIMFSVNTNIYIKEAKGPNLMELFTATGKPKKFFFWQLEMFDMCTMCDTAHIDMLFKFLAHTHTHTHTHMRASTWVHRYSSLLQWSVPLGQRGHVAMVLCTKCMLHSNHRLTVWYSNTQNDFSPRSGHFLTTCTCIA
jgi:hypothetical protein